MITFAYAEQIRAACELLYDLAAVQVENDQHPHAPIVLEWLDHVGAVAARCVGGELASHQRSVLTLPPAGGMQ